MLFDFSIFSLFNEIDNLDDNDIYFDYRGFMIWLRILLPFLVPFVASCPNAVELNTSKDVIACIINDGGDDHEDDGHHT